MADIQLQKELDYFKENQKELVSKYASKFLVIKNQKIEGVYDTELGAYEDAKKRFELGTFLIQHCVADEESYTQTFHSRVIIS